MAGEVVLQEDPVLQESQEDDEEGGGEEDAAEGEKALLLWEGGKAGVQMKRGQAEVEERQE